MSDSDYWEVYSGKRSPPRGVSIELPATVSRGNFGHVISMGVWSEELVFALREVGASGLSSYPVRVTHRGVLLRDYRGVVITGRGGKFDAIRSQVTRWSSLPGIPMFFRGVFMDCKEWDKSDVFLIEGFGSRIFVSERVVDAVRSLKDLKDLKVRRNDEVTSP